MDLGPLREQLPQAVVDQYLFNSGERVVLEGTMERVWRHGRWLWPLFWLASWVDALFPETGKDVPVTLVIEAERSGHRHVWRREFRFPRRRRFTSRIEYDERLGCVVEMTGPADVLAIAWGIRVESPSRLELTCTGWVLRLGPWRPRLPDWVLGSGRATETADPAQPGTIRIDFAVTHPLLGDVFGYVGSFRVKREPAP